MIALTGDRGNGGISQRAMTVSVPSTRGRRIIYDVGIAVMSPRADTRKIMPNRRRVILKLTGPPRCCAVDPRCDMTAMRRMGLRPMRPATPHGAHKSTRFGSTDKLCAKTGQSVSMSAFATLP